MTRPEWTRDPAGFTITVVLFLIVLSAYAGWMAGVVLMLTEYQVPQ